jgi:hypothetical protein
MKSGKSFVLASYLLAGLFGAAGMFCVTAADASVRFFGRGAPATIESLPAGDMREALAALPDKVRARALSWLQAIEFSEQDLAYLRVDPQGGIYYADTFVGERSSGRTTHQSAASPTTLTKKSVFKLHSRPGASRTLFLDFNGGGVSGTAWNAYRKVKEWDVLAYDTDGKPGAFSREEVADMAEIWQQVAEDFIPFDVDVTTEDPGKLGPTVGWVLVTRSTDADARPLPEPKAGGVAYVNTFGYGQTDFYSPLFVYYDNLGSPAAVADAASHEIGHMVGLTHDGTTVSLNRGKGRSGNLSWSPIMSLDHSARITQWSRGDYRGATNSQDDVGILTGSLGLRRDDHEDTRFATGTPLAVNSRGHIIASDPYAAEERRNPKNRGVSEDHDDIDVFVFNSGAGTVDIHIDPARDAAHAKSRDGANLDIQATLYNARGKKIASTDPRNDNAANLKVKVPAGRYTIEVTGVGSTVAPYSSYGSLGQYFISGTIPVHGSRSVAELTK